MAKMTFKAGDEWALKLDQLGERSGAIAKKAIYPAAGLLADRIKANIQALPEDTYRYLRDGDIFTGVPPEEKEELIEAYGISSIEQDKDGTWNAKVGVSGAGYGKRKTKKYPKGIPLTMLARPIERGSSVRKATPFVKPAIRAVKKEAIAMMQQVIDDEAEKIMKGK